MKKVRIKGKWHDVVWYSAGALHGQIRLEDTSVAGFAAADVEEWKETVTVTFSTEDANRIRLVLIEQLERWRAMSPHDKSGMPNMTVDQAERWAQAMHAVFDAKLREG